MKKIDVCPGTLAAGFDKYSPACIRNLFNDIQVSPFLDFNYNADHADFIAAVNRISISGIQEKLSAIISDKKIRLTPEGEHGKYIIKPAPDYKHLRFRDQIPANEHLTMQIARQGYKIKTAENGMVLFANGEAAYITKRLHRFQRSDELQSYKIGPKMLLTSALFCAFRGKNHPSYNIP